MLLIGAILRCHPEASVVVDNVNCISTIRRGTLASCTSPVHDCVFLQSMSSARAGVGGDFPIKHQSGSETDRDIAAPKLTIKRSRSRVVCAGIQTCRLRREA